MLPPRHDPRWESLVDQPEQYVFDFLALRILMQRITRRRVSMSRDDRQATLDEVYGFFEKNEKLIGNEIALIFG
jgi:hypothetical protein